MGFVFWDIAIRIQWHGPRGRQGRCSILLTHLTEFNTISTDLICQWAQKMLYIAL